MEVACNREILRLIERGSDELLQLLKSDSVMLPGRCSRLFLWEELPRIVLIRSSCILYVHTHYRLRKKKVVHIL